MKSGTGKKILLLDDNPDILDIVGQILTYENYLVESTHTSKDFILKALEFMPDLIILDYRLTDGNGGELCSKIKKHPALLHIPVIIFTAYKSPGLELTIYGCDAVISKPFDLEYLLACVNELLTAKPINKADNFERSDSDRSIP